MTNRKRNSWYIRECVSANLQAIRRIAHEKGESFTSRGSCQPTKLIFDHYLPGYYWLYKVSVDKKEISFQYMMLFAYKEGIGAAMPMPHTNYMLYFSDHFFKRFNQRHKLGLTSETEIIKSFLYEAEHFEFFCLQSPVEVKFFCITECGILLGTVDEQSKIAYVRTFFTHAMLNQWQQQLEKLLLEKLHKHQRRNAA